MQRVFVLDANQQPLMPCHPARARELLSKGKAAVYRRYPFTIILKYTVEADNQPITLFRYTSKPPDAARARCAAWTDTGFRAPAPNNSSVCTVFRPATWYEQLCLTARSKARIAEEWRCALQARFELGKLTVSRGAIATLVQRADGYEYQ